MTNKAGPRVDTNNDNNNNDYEHLAPQGIRTTALQFPVLRLQWTGTAAADQRATNVSMQTATNIPAQ